VAKKTKDSGGAEEGAKKKTQGGGEPGKVGPQHEGPLICGGCGGSGQVATEERIEIDGKPTTRTDWVKCPQCKGSGEIR
jgi:hypothetical protein